MSLMCSPLSSDRSAGKSNTSRSPNLIIFQAGRDILFRMSEKPAILLLQPQTRVTTNFSVPRCNADQFKQAE